MASWIEMIMTVRVNLNPDVEAYVASWIEILTFAHRRSTPPVEAYTASWIEIIAVSYMTTGSVASRLIRPYGLK